MSERKGLRITRVYTKTGDKGETGLVGGQRVPKDHPRIEAYGTVDELAAALGVARVELEGERARFRDAADAETLAAHMRYIQNQLFTLGGDLATRLEDRHPMMPILNGSPIEYLERLCDGFNGSLPPLKDFILAGGSRTATALHVARTVCRRAERVLARLAREEDIGEHSAIYVNRLSDALFVLARWANARMGVEEYLWDRTLDEPPIGG